MPEVLTGQPARRATWRAMLKPVAPSGLAQPMSTSSTEPGSTWARSIAALTTWPPSVAPWVRLNAPRQDLASAVRAVETMTASTTGFSFRALSAGADRRRRVVERATFGRELHQQFRGLPGPGLGVRIRGEFTHAAQHLAQSHLGRVEHGTTPLHRESIA